MTNYILSGDTTINGHLVINGITYIAKTEESLQQIEDIDTLTGPPGPPGPQGPSLWTQSGNNIYYDKTI